jgi:hypothetical protein
VAFAILGIGLAGLSQLVVMQIRQVRVLENRIQGQVGRYNRAWGTYTTMRDLGYDANTKAYTVTPMGQTYYLVPWQNAWTRKLSGAAQIVAGSSTIPGDPSFVLSGQAAPTYTVSIQSLDTSESSQSVTAVVQLNTP